MPGIPTTVVKALACLLAMALLNNAHATSFCVLDGIERGQSLSMIETAIGPPAQRQTLDGDRVAHVFQRGDYYLVLETHRLAPDVIDSIQITGSGNPAHHGLSTINLGDSVASVTNAVGNPDQTKGATDAATGKDVAATSLYRYPGYSFEIQGGKVTSILLDGPTIAVTAKSPDIHRLIADTRGGDAYAVAEWLHPELTVGNRPAFSGPILDAVATDPKLRGVLFGKRGVASLDANTITDEAVRIFDRKIGNESQVSEGYVYKFKTGRIRELFFILGVSGGWQLYEVNY